jgi:ABC-type Fe3+ transport system substrate-binding protein
MITFGEPQGIVKSFLDYILSDLGQGIVANEGYLPVK